MELINRPLRAGLWLFAQAWSFRGRYRVVDYVSARIAPPAGSALRVNGVSIGVNQTSRHHRFMYYGLYERGMVRFLGKYLRKGDVVLEPGANIAYMSAVCLGLVGPTGKVYSFEPSPSAFARIRQHNRQEDHPNWFLWNSALSDHVGKGTFYDTPRVMMLGYACLSDVSSPKDGIPYEVQLDTVDNFCKAQNINQVRFLKLDVEGAELLALRGAARMIGEKAIDIIMVETSTVGPHRPQAEQIDRLLKAAEYRSFHVKDNGNLLALEVLAGAPKREDVIWLAPGVHP